MAFIIIVIVIIVFFSILNSIAKNNRYAPALRPGQSALSPQAQMLTAMNKIAHEVTDGVMNIYTKKVNSGVTAPVYETALVFFKEEYAKKEICETIEGICYSVGFMKLPEKMMNMRLAQFIGMVNDCLLRKPNKPYTSQSQLVRCYELLDLKEVYDRSPNLFKWNEF